MIKIIFIIQNATITWIISAFCSTLALSLMKVHSNISKEKKNKITRAIRVAFCDKRTLSSHCGNDYRFVARLWLGSYKNAKTLSWKSVSSYLPLSNAIRAISRYRMIFPRKWACEIFALIGCYQQMSWFSLYFICDKTINTFKSFILYKKKVIHL